MISKIKRAIYIHIPKTSGTSVADTLLETGEFRCSSRFDFLFMAKRMIEVNKFPNDETKVGHKHYPISSFARRYNDYFKFAFVRNPWDLMVSSYSWWTQRTVLFQRKDIGSSILEKGFKSFVINYSGFLNEVNHMGQGQHFWLTDRNSELITDYIGRFETIEQDFQHVCSKIGLSSIKLPHNNKSTHDHYSKYYDNETRDIVFESFKRDIEYFDYSF